MLRCSAWSLITSSTCLLLYFGYLTQFLQLSREPHRSLQRVNKSSQLIKNVTRLGLLPSWPRFQCCVLLTLYFYFIFLLRSVEHMSQYSLILRAKLALTSPASSSARERCKFYMLLIYFMPIIFLLHNYCCVSLNVDALWSARGRKKERELLSCDLYS